jgi:uncharacterized protein
MWEHAPANCKVFLSRHYRSRPAIARAVSALFYKGDVDPRRSNESDLITWEPSLVWLNTFGFGFGQQERDKSVCNPPEARDIIELLAALSEALPEANRATVAVVAAYRAQRALLGKELAASGLASRFKECVVRTIDATQGGQWDVVVLALSRCEGSSRFLGSPNRLNVALSRAREMAFIVGSNRYALACPASESALPRLARYCERNEGRGIRICYPNLQGGVREGVRRVVQRPDWRQRP